MADEKAYTEAEHIAILSDRVAKETADLTAERDQLVSDKSELETKLDVTESAKQAAEQKAADAEQALEEFKGQVEQDREAAARKEERIAKCRESAEHLGEDFFKDETRVERIVAMSDEHFEGYLADLSATSTPTTKTAVPRETAMAGSAPAAGGESAGKSFLLRRYTQEG